MTTAHKYKDLIIAWANGAQIEYYDPYFKEWLSARYPSWDDILAYRMKPEDKPDVTRYSYLETHGARNTKADREKYHNIKHTYDGETGILKSVEIIK